MGKEDFILKAKKVHGNKYDYSKVNYKNANTKVCIICPEHGEFWQTPGSHVFGSGCKKCGAKIVKEKNSSTKEDFILKARKVHGWKYDYSKVKYVNKKTPICIICPEHGEFWQTPDSHLQGNGCKKCTKEKLSNERLKTNEEWVNEVTKIHNNKYDYKKTVYKGYRKKVIITCPIHGDFEQLAYNHLQGKGCPKCRMSHLEIEIEKLLTENKINFIEQYRPKFLNIGKSHLSVDFFLPDYNVAIECQGKQHFIKNTFYSQNIERIIERDKLKKRLLENNGINVLYYTNENVNEYFGEIFSTKDSIIKKIKGYERLL